MGKELGVIIKSKDLSEYIFLVTDSSPKKYRLTLVARLQNLSLDVIENLYYANGIRIDSNCNDVPKQRTDYQRDAKIRLDMLCIMADIARKQQCIQPKHYYQICRQAAEIRKLIYAWAKSDITRTKNLSRDNS